MRGWPLPRPTHAPATTLKTNGDSVRSRNGSQSNHKRIPPPPRRLGGGFNPLRGATTGVVIRRRATTGVDGTRGLVIVIPEFSAWLTLVLEQCRAENIRNLPRQRAPTPLFPERRPREACSMPISGCHDLPLATFNLPSRVFRHGCRHAGCPERRWGGFFHILKSGRGCHRRYWRFWRALPGQPAPADSSAGVFCVRPSAV